MRPAAVSPSIPRQGIFGLARPESLLVTATLTGLVAIGAISTDLYLPSLPAIAAAFETDAAEVQLTLSVFLAGFALSQIACGPMSDAWGRRPVLIGGLSLYLAATLLCIFAPTIEVLIGARFVQALGGCAGVVLARAIVRDIHGREEAARMLSYMSLAMALAPAVGPILGGLLQSSFGWQVNFVALALFALVMLASVVALLPETNPWRDPGALRAGRLAANYRRLAGDRAYLGYVLVASAAYSGIFAFISGSSFLIIDGLGLPPHLYGFCFAAVVVGYMCGAFASGRLNRRLGLDRLILLGAGLACLGGLPSLGLTLAGPPSLVGLVLPVAVYCAGAGLLLPNAMAGAVGNYPRMAGTASALLGFIQMTLAALIGIGVGHLDDASGRAMTAAIAFAALTALFARLCLVPARAGAEVADR